MLGSRKLAVSITTWFCVPEFGMKDMEVLCRGSAFLVRTKQWKNKDKDIVRLLFVRAYISFMDSNFFILM
jgi:hypothetical protein